MTGHYFLIGIVIAVIIFFQLKVYFRTSKKRRQFNSIFPDKADEEWIVLKNEGVQIVSKQKAVATETIRIAKDEIEKIAVKLVPIQKTIERYSRYRDDAVLNGGPELISKYELALGNENQKKREWVEQDKEWKRKKKEAEKQLENLKQLQSKLEGGTRSVIIDSINKYLEKNKNAVTDFNLIRDIIDRNADAVEEEIQTQIPMPLYYGLMGTMLGILIGVSFLVSSGSLKSLLSSYEAPTTVQQLTPEDKTYLKSTFPTLSYKDWNAKRELTDNEKRELRKKFDDEASNGVNALFGGIALAMISSIIGILLTTLGSIQTKDSKVEVEQKKHAFISWLQAELLPKISSDFSSALIQLGHDLSGFNNTFSSNANLLRQTISDVSQATLTQSSLLQLIERLDVAKLAQANIQVYDKLQNCTQEMASLAANLRAIQDSIQYVGNFMDNSINEYERRHTFIQDASGKVDLALQRGQEQLSNEASVLFDRYNELLNTLYMRSEATTKQLADKYDAQAESIHKAIVEKLSDVRQLENELKNLVAVKSSIANLEKATLEQNRKIDNLTGAIRELAQVKVTGGSTSVSMHLPKLYRILIITATSIISFAGLFVVVLRVLDLLGVVR